MASLWALSWHSPYTEPPDGKPRDLAAVMLADTNGHRAPCPQWLLDLHKPGDGYSIYYSFLPDKPARRLSDEAKFSIRRKRLEARIRKKYPLFAESMIADAIQRKPDYYGQTGDAQ